MSRAGASQRRRVVYFGRVQGVGFRLTAAHIAERHEVVGFVRNLPDGSVELEVEGAADEVDRFLSAVAARMGANISRADARDLPARQDEPEFRIRD